MIARDIQSATRESYDLAVIGGGIYGVALLLESARRGLKGVLVERGDFGGATSWNSLRIVHGGLRYLQSLDLRRFKESVAERRWFLRHYPELVEPLACLMPLYGRGIKRPSVFRVALEVNHFLSRGRNVGIRADRALGKGRILDLEETRAAFPGVDRQGLVGSAMWYDGSMPDSQRLLIEMLHWACACGSTALNYVQAERPLLDGSRVVGLGAKDVESGTTLELRAPVVVNCSGPWSRETAGRFDRDVPELFRPSLAMNLLLDREPPSEMALAVTAKAPGSRTYFLHPWKGLTFAGTYHAPWAGKIDVETVPEQAVRAFLDDLNQALPGRRLSESELLRVHWGLLPAAAEGTDEIASREVLYDHGANGGPVGMYSVSGVKFTTARLVAEKTLNFIAPLREQAESPRDGADRPGIVRIPAAAELEARIEADPGAVTELVKALIESESVCHLDDLLLRRTDWDAHPKVGNRVAERLMGMLAWNEPRRSAELARLTK